MTGVTVAIPVRDGGEALRRTLRALTRQTLEHELLVCDSGSRDRSANLAREAGAKVIEIAASAFNHGATRNLLLREAQGEHVALLSQDAEPASERWLERLMAGFDLAGDLALVFGPYRPRPESSAVVKMELERWFASLSPDGLPHVERLASHERDLPARELVGRRGFFTDANGAIARRAWERVPFRELAYAEDRALAMDMLRAGYAKAYVPDAAVVHSHDYTASQQVRRCFDEWRGLLEVYGWREPAAPLRVARQLAGELRRARDELPAMHPGSAVGAATLASVSRHHVARLAGAMLGSHADRLPAGLRRVLSLEGRATFEPLTPRDRT
jgi:glycosyltransferase involved in cell wall biosynthesis